MPTRKLIEALVSWLIDCIVSGLTAHPSAAAADEAVSVTVAGRGLTMGQLRAAMHGAPGFVSALGHLIEGHATLADTETVADDVIAAALALAGPSAAPFAAIAPMIANLFIEGLADGTIKPSAHPIADGQSTPPTHGWVGR